MTLRPHIPTKSAIRRSFATVMIVAAIYATIFLAAAVLSGENQVRAQGNPTPTPEPTGLIKEITPSVRNLNVDPGITISLSINVIGLQNVRDQSLGSDVVFNWSATDGELPRNEEGNTTVRYTTPDRPGNYTVSVSTSDNCRGTCSTSFSITVRIGAGDGSSASAAVNPPGPIPTVLTDSDGNNYEVFTPEGGGSFDGERFSINAEAGVVPNGEYIGVRMYENGAASNAGMSGHRFTLSGAIYSVAVIDSGQSSATSYKLNDVATICVPLPEMLLGNIAEVQMVAVSDDGVSLTAMTSDVRVAPALAVCGYTSTLPVNVAAAIPGVPPALPEEDEDTAVLPATGGVSPASTPPLVWALMIGITLIVSGTVTFAMRRQRVRSR